MYYNIFVLKIIFMTIIYIYMWTQRKRKIFVILYYLESIESVNFLSRLINFDEIMKKMQADEVGWDNKRRIQKL
jgi:hypothetical protein